MKYKYWHNQHGNVRLSALKNEYVYDINNESETKYLSGVWGGGMCGVCVWGVCGVCVCVCV